MTDSASAPSAPRTTGVVLGIAVLAFSIMFAVVLAPQLGLTSLLPAAPAASDNGPAAPATPAPFEAQPPAAPPAQIVAPTVAPTAQDAPQPAARPATFTSKRGKKKPHRRTH